MITLTCSENTSNHLKLVSIYPNARIVRLTMSSVREFYRNEQVLITGGTGFVGKLLISKLLTSCPEIEKIILLIRKKGDEGANARLEKLFNDTIFDSLREQNPRFYEKIDLVEGDCEQKHLGLSQMDRFLLTQNVTIVLHCAANVEFTNDLKTEVIANVVSAIEIINLVKCVRNLKAFVYVSTAFSNCHLPLVEEKFYEPNISYDRLVKLTQTDYLQTNEQSILGDIATTYFYSKAAAEQAILQEGDGLPIGVFRPSAIISTWKEPVEGWSDKAFAPTGVAKSLILGQVASVICTDDTILDMVPADFVVNALISVAWDVHYRFINNNMHEPRIYNYTSMMDNPLRLKEFYQKIYKMVQQKPSQRSTWCPAVSFPTTRRWNRIAAIIRPWLMAYVLQIWYQTWTKKKVNFMKGCKLYETLMDIMESFTKKPHIFCNDNIRELWKDLNETDRKMYPFDMKMINWDIYLKVYYDGILKYLIKEKNRDEEDALKHHFKLQTLQSIVKGFAYSMACILIYLVFYYIS